MARLDRFRFSPHVLEISGVEVTWKARTDYVGKIQQPQTINDVPSLYWADGKPWHEANLYFADRAELIPSGQLKIGTIETVATALLAYMKFLEERPEIAWFRFPKEKAERPTTLFRGALIKARDSSEIAASTASARMSGVIRWYRWVHAKGLLSPTWPAWEERLIGIRISDAYGFERAMTVRSTDLSIPNRKRNKDSLEDGLLPVSLIQRDRILGLSARHSSEEFHLMLRLGFMTGMRLGSICDLKLKTLENASRLAETDKAYYLTIGPGVRAAPVRTKHDVTGRVIIPADLLCDLRSYLSSERRLIREAKALPEHKDMVFLNRFGRPYGGSADGRSPSINVDMLRLRRAALDEGENLNDFYFHRSRATFATSIAEAALRIPGANIVWGEVIALIRDLLLHKDEATSMRYITFVKKQKVRAYWANEFTRYFFGASPARPTESSEDA